MPDEFTPASYRPTTLSFDRDDWELRLNECGCLLFRGNTYTYYSFDLNHMFAVALRHRCGE